MPLKADRPLRIAAIGCGGRTQTYLELASRQPSRFAIVAAADPIPARLERIRRISGDPSFRGFDSDVSLLREPLLADLMVIGTQDGYHFDPCMAAMEKGYDILLEKPIANDRDSILTLAQKASELGRRVMVCHVLRYTPFYNRVHALVRSGAVGEIVTLHASEGVDPWHQAHSYVRGHWAVTEKSSPMILAKSCHDMDILTWLIDRPCLKVSSFGSLLHFHSGNAPPDAPTHCLLGCPLSGDCLYHAAKYLREEARWLGYVFDRAEDASDQEKLEWLKREKWGRCVYRCDNTAVDHQTVNLEFENGVTATFTMTAFDSGRNIEIFGTKGVLRGGEFIRREFGCDLVVRQHGDEKYRQIKIDENRDPCDGHGGGDAGLIDALYHEMRISDPKKMRSSLQRSVESHLIAFAAEGARRTGTTIVL